MRPNRRFSCSSVLERAIGKQPTCCLVATSGLSDGGPPAGFRNGLGTWPIPTTLSRKPSLQTFKRIERFEPRGVGSLHAYLRQAILNRIREELRKKGRRPDATEVNGLEVESGQSPLELAIGREAIERYEQALGRLRAEEQEAIIGRVEMGYTYEELAQALGKSSSDAARKAAQRALVRLVKEMARGVG